jgi:CspA family cold shock protein
MLGYKASLRLKKAGRISQKTLHKKMTGTIKTKTDRGYGFIIREGEAKDLFFHSKDLNGVTFDELKEGDVVSFEVAEGQKGPSAVNVTRA